MIIHLPTLRDSVYRASVLSLLNVCDNDFSPPLSYSRFQGSQNVSVEQKLLRYLEEKDPFHHYLLTFHKHRVVGMLNFVITENQIEIDTICVHPSYRDQQIGYAFYAYVMGQICVHYDVKDILVTTNSSALAHLHLLQKLHFSPVEGKPNTYHKKIRF